MRKENPELQYLAGDDWHPTYTRYLRREELKDRLNAYTKLSVKYAKSVIELNAAQLILNTDERHRIEYSLELLLQHITNRLDEILYILARDNMLRKRGKKRVYTLPRINPRAANLNSMEDTQKLGREIQDDVMEILHYAFNPIPEGEEDRIEVCYDGSDIADDNTRRKKTKQLPTGHSNEIRISAGQNADRPHHTVNFNDREQHRTSTLDEVQQQLTQMAQGNSSANMANVRPARLSDKPQATEDGETWPKGTSVPMVRTTILVQQVTQAHPQIGMDAGERKNAQLVEEKVTTRETAEPNGTMNFGAPGAIETITATTLAD